MISSRDTGQRYGSAYKQIGSFHLSGDAGQRSRRSSFLPVDVGKRAGIYFA